MAVSLSTENSPEVDFFENLEACFRHRLKSFRLALIDIPLGLKARGPEERLCEPLARMKLQQRRSSVFPVPARAVLYEAKDPVSASQINFERTGKKISRQTWNICPKMREADMFLLDRPALAGRVVESHPELCFAALTEGRALCYAKTARVDGCKAGLEERALVLKKYWKHPEAVYPAFAKRYPGTAKADDLLDAMVLAVSARLITEKDAWCSLPENPPFDERGIPMRMVYPAPEKIRDC